MFHPKGHINPRDVSCRGGPAAMPASTGLSRREVLKLSLLGSAALLLPLGHALRDETRGALGDPRTVPTSFGTVALSRAEKVPAFTAEQVAVLTYGVRESAPPVQNVLVHAWVVLTNALEREVGYSPEQFRLTSDGSGGPTPPSESTLRAGALRPGVSIGAALGFVVPRDGSRLGLEFREPEAIEPVLFDLGRTDAAAGDGLPSRRRGGTQGGHH